MLKRHSGKGIFWVKMPDWVKKLPGFYWPKPVNRNGVFITFDDGPHPETTPRILDLLRKNGVYATFFCLGNHAQKYPELTTRISAEGHTIGNHTFSHCDGWKTGNHHYKKDLEQSAPITSDRLMRPPYGHISPVQLFSARRNGYKVVLWDIMPGDFEEETSTKVCVQRISDNLLPGQNIVLHENEKSKEKVVEILGATLSLLKARNLVAEKILI